MPDLNKEERDSLGIIICSHTISYILKTVVSIVTVKICLPKYCFTMSGHFLPITPLSLLPSVDVLFHLYVINSVE